MRGFRGEALNLIAPTFSPELVRTDQRWQIADVKTPLLSVEEECDKDQWVILTKHGGYIHNPATQDTRRIDREKEGGFEIDMYVSVKPPSFTRQGP